MFVTVDTRGPTAGRVQPVRQGFTRPQQVHCPARFAQRTPSARRWHQRRQIARRVRRILCPSPGAEASICAFVMPDTTRQQRTMRAWSAFPASTTTPWIGTSAPSAREASIPLPGVPLASRRVRHAKRARGRRRAARRVSSVQPVRTLLRPLRSFQTASATQDRRARMDRRAFHVRRASTSLRQALPRARTAAPARTPRLPELL